jgi:hypothetical protein
VPPLTGGLARDISISIPHGQHSGLSSGPCPSGLLIRLSHFVNHDHHFGHSLLLSYEKSMSHCPECIIAVEKSNRKVVKFVISLVEKLVFWSHIVCPMAGFSLCIFFSSFPLWQPGTPGPSVVVDGFSSFLWMLRSRCWTSNSCDD